MTRSFIASLSTAALAVLLATPAARAKDFCIPDAKVELKDCKTSCSEDYQVAKDDCLNRDHACMEVCRAEREECRLATGIDADFARCRADLQQAKQRCRAMHPAGSTELGQCIDQAQVVAFQCRDAARERAKRALKVCRRTFRGCAMACPPADPSAPPVDVVACRNDARQAYNTCRANCLEDFQVAKDACHNRDHACVERCRSDRDACRDPVLTQLESDIAACNEEAPRAIKAGSASPNGGDHARADSARGASTASATEAPAGVVESSDPQIHGMQRAGSNDAAYQAAYRSCMRRKGF